MTLPTASIFSFYFFFSIKKILYYSNDKDNYLSFIYLLLLIFSVFSFNNYTNYGNDASTHIFFFLLILIFLENINKLNENNTTFFKLVLISLFLFSQKLFMILAFIIILYVFFIFKEKLKLFKDVKFYVVTFILFSILLKNVLTSSCILFPIKQSCFSNLSFHNDDVILKEGISGEAWSKSWSDQKKEGFLQQDEFIENFNWIDTWLSNHFFEILEEIAPFLMMTLLICIYLIFSSGQKNFKFKKQNNKNQIFLLFFTTFSIIIWFLKFPLYRYGESFIAVFISLIISNFLKNRLLSYVKFKKLSLLLLTFCFSLFIIKNSIRIYDNYNFIDNSQPWPKIYTLSDTDENQIPKYKSILNNKKELLYYFSGGRECMYSKPPCSNFLNKNVNLKYIRNYKIFYVEKNN